MHGVRQLRITSKQDVLRNGDADGLTGVCSFLQNKQRIRSKLCIRVHHQEIAFAIIHSIEIGTVTFHITMGQDDLKNLFHQ